MSKTHNHHQIDAIRSSSREMRLEMLSNVGFVDGHKVVPSKKDKANSEKKQRQDFKNGKFE
jgi:hypothetical protein